MAEQITLSIAGEDLTFEPSQKEINGYINDLGADKIQPSYNLLSRTIIDDDKDKLKAIATKDGVVLGHVVATAAGALYKHHTGDFSVEVKKPSGSPEK